MFRSIYKWIWKGFVSFKNRENKHINGRPQRNSCLMQVSQGQVLQALHNTHPDRKIIRNIPSFSLVDLANIMLSICTMYQANLLQIPNLRQKGKKATLHDAIKSSAPADPCALDFQLFKQSVDRAPLERSRRASLL